MRVFDVALVLLSHLFASGPFWASILRSKLPNTSDFAVISVIFYYDIGLILELLGSKYESPFFTSLLTADEGQFLLAMFFIGLAPWLFHLGAFVANGSALRQSQLPISHLSESRRTSFYGVTALFSLGLAFYGTTRLLTGAPIWLLREQIGLQWGPLIVVLYLPLHILAFYVRQRDSRTIKGLLFALFLVAGAILSTFVIGERTNMLLPFLTLALFRFRLSLGRLATIVGVLLLAASILLPALRWQYAGTEANVGDLVAATISGDISRSPVLNSAIELAEPLGTKVLPYPMAGYVYSALFFVPRQVVPFKGGPTAQYFTGYIANTDPEETTWVLGVGVIEELIINAGLLLVIPGLFVYGLAMGLLDKASARTAALAVPSRLAAVWLCGYNLPAILLLFGTMSLVGLLLHKLFAAPSLHARISLQHLVAPHTDSPLLAGRGEPGLGEGHANI